MVNYLTWKWWQFPTQKVIHLQPLNIATISEDNEHSRDPFLIKIAVFLSTLCATNLMKLNLRQLQKCCCVPFKTLLSRQQRLQKSLVNGEIQKTRNWPRGDLLSFFQIRTRFKICINEPKTNWDQKCFHFLWNCTLIYIHFKFSHFALHRPRPSLLIKLKLNYMLNFSTNKNPIMSNPTFFSEW